MELASGLLGTRGREGEREGEREREERREGESKGGRGESPCSFTALTSQLIHTIVVHT